MPEKQNICEMLLKTQVNLLEVGQVEVEPEYNPFHDLANELHDIYDEEHDITLDDRNDLNAEDEEDLSEDEEIIRITVHIPIADHACSGGLETGKDEES